MNNPRPHRALRLPLATRFGPRGVLMGALCWLLLLAVPCRYGALARADETAHFTSCVYVADGQPRFYDKGQAVDTLLKIRVPRATEAYRVRFEATDEMGHRIVVQETEVRLQAGQPPRGRGVHGAAARRRLLAGCLGSAPV